MNGDEYMTEAEKISRVKAEKEAKKKADKAAKKEYDAERRVHRTKEQKDADKKRNANWLAKLPPEQKEEREKKVTAQALIPVNIPTRA